MTDRKKKPTPKKSIQVGDTVNYHSIIGRGATSSGHEVLSIDKGPNNYGGPVAWISNKSGLFNVPFGRYKNINYIREFPNIEKTIQNWTLQCGDFSKTQISKTDFLYADPPYDVEFKNYSGKGFQWEEQERLVQFLSKYECPIVISNQATNRIKSLYEKNGYNILLIDAPRMISCNGDRTKAKEVIALKNVEINN